MNLGVSQRLQTDLGCSKSSWSCVKRQRALVKCDFVNVVVAKQSETVLLFVFCNKFETICVKAFYGEIPHKVHTGKCLQTLEGIWLLRERGWGGS